MSKISQAKDISSVENEITQLYKSTSYALWAKLIRTFIPPRTEDQLEDPYLDGWRKMLEKRSQYQSGLSVYNWIFTIMKNTTLNTFTNVRNRLGVNIDETNVPGLKTLILDAIPEALPTAEDLLQAKQLQEMIDEVITEKLHPKERVALKSYLYNNKTQTVISQEMGVSLGTVNTLIKSAKDKLKYYLETKTIEIANHV